MGLIHCNGVELNCQTLGHGPKLVMCHGLVFGSMATWYFTAAAKLAERFEVILYDQRGHGKSSMAVSGYDIATLAVDLDCLVRHCQSQDDGPVALVGHSYGALVALEYALGHPGQVSKLVLVDAPLPAGHYVFPSMSHIDSPEALDASIPEEIRQKSMRGSRSAGKLRERMEFLFLKSTLPEDVRLSGDIADDRLRQLEIPVLCLYGRSSDCLAAGQRLANVLPHARLSLLDCGHYIPLEAPQEMTKLLDEFL